MYKNQHFHFVGINGIGMSGIAKILHRQGHIVSGCDLGQDTANIQDLIDAGCKISNQHNTTICQDNSINIVVYSSDVPYHAPELVNARNRGIKTIQRAVALAEIIRTKTALGVAGSHGKTTTTSMIGQILTYAQTDPTIIVGGIMHNIASNARYGQGKYAVAETDESDRSHLLLPISIGILTSVDYEHANVYKNLDEVIEVFIQYLNKLPFYGKAIVCIDDKNIENMLPKIQSSIITYGTTAQADIQAINIQLHPDFSTFNVMDNRTQQLLGSVTIQMPSIYNVLNATAAITACLELNISFESIAQALALYQGVDRRFTLKGTMKTPIATIFDDYGHHPTEIYHSLITARRKAQNKLIVVFQPQRYTRTYHLWDEFIQVLQSADIDHLIITDIYGANEPIIENITGKRLAEEIIKKNPHAKIHYVPYQADLADIKNRVLEIITDNDLLLLLGAGKVNKLAEKLL
ncbi:UDP-N-acetylmuramate--L-alanine ligase [Candidatus Babeliales bacterium]|nr:UDP-N-acetylmuramate--L-alanine ligase [Candidatus Babeliales bacterium]MBP9843613.1 UDP-N-acetylmuramate--L-alanine ligase [Candidatus Babeliales bacterium]